ncbi:MAG: heme NO-binding domain-containing protein [Pseudomonadota bacterium]
MIVLINRALEGFLRDTYGGETWNAIDLIADTEIEFFDFDASEFDPVSGHDFHGMLDAAVEHLGKSRDDVLEDLGTYLVSHPNMDVLRRLLRFGGVTFPDFLHSLDDLPDRARLAVSDLRLPGLELVETAPLEFDLLVARNDFDFGRILVGVIRAMADDYGSLAMIDLVDKGKLRIAVHHTEFAEAKPFELVSSQ